VGLLLVCSTACSFLGANGITGGVIYILMFDHLIKTASFPWAIRAIGFVALAAALLSIPALLSGSAWLKHKRKRRALFDRSALRDRLFLLFTCCSFSTFLGYIVPYFYIPTFARVRRCICWCSVLRGVSLGGWQVGWRRSGWGRSLRGCFVRLRVGFWR
jgi:hypothetical protein